MGLVDYASHLGQRKESRLSMICVTLTELVDLFRYCVCWHICIVACVKDVYFAIFRGPACSFLFCIYYVSIPVLGCLACLFAMIWFDMLNLPLFSFTLMSLKQGPARLFTFCFPRGTFIWGGTCFRDRRVFCFNFAFICPRLACFGQGSLVLFGRLLKRLQVSCN